nr:unnamed protein product [Callosobruchus chinensis]
MYFFKQLILGILLLEAICISVHGSITGYIDSADKQKFLQILSRTLEPPVDDTVSLYYGAKGLQILKKEINKAKIPEVCKTLKTKFSATDSLENVFFSLSTWNVLGCQGKLHEEKLVKELQSILGNENSPVADIRYALEIHSLLKYQAPQPQNIAKTIVNCLRKDDSLPELGHALHAAALLGGEKGNGKFGVERAEEAVARADELDGRLLQWEGGLSVTSLILTGLLRLYPTGTQLPLAAAQADKVASYLLTRRTVPTAKGVLALLEAAHALADSQLSPVSITIVGPAVVTADRPELRVYVGDLLGRPIRAAAPVVAQSATRLADDVVVLAKQPLSPGTAQGEFTLPLKLEPSLYKIALNTANGASASFDVRVLGPMEVHWLEIGLSDTDGGGIPSQPSRLRFPSGKLQDRLQADAGQRLVVRLSLSRPIHQVFLRLGHREDGREIIFVAEPETSGASSGQDAKIYKVEVSPGEELAASGLYDMEAILGDSVITNPVKWNIGQVDVNLGTAGVRSSKKLGGSASSVISRRGPKPEIQHQFRPKDRRPPALVSYLFTGLTAAPWLVLLVLWARIGAGIDTSKFHVTLAIPYHLSLAAVLGLYTLFWLKLDMFTTCGWLAPLGAVTFLTGHRLLARLAADRTGKEKPEK